MENTFNRVYEIVKQVPYGRVTTYGRVAALLGNPRLSRVVGYALNACPSDQNIPWHRVVNRFGGLTKVCEENGINIQRILLEAEGINFIDDYVDMDKYLW